MSETAYDIHGTCESCTRKIDGLGRRREDGALFHLSCWEREGIFTEPPQPGNKGLRIYKVRLEIRETETVMVVAESEYEAMDLAMRTGYRRHDDCEATDADLQSREPTADECEEYVEQKERIKKEDAAAAERAAARMAMRTAERIAQHNANRDYGDEHKERIAA